jgi:exonuclease SbcC
MKLEKIFIENLKIFPKLELYLEDYDLALITGPNGAGKTTAFVAVPVIAFYNEFNGRSLKDYALENKVAKIGLEFEHEGKRYIIVRQYSDGSTQSIFTDIIEKRKISKSREIQNTIEKLFGMDAKTFLNTVVIAQGEVETLSERAPKERRELFLKFLGIDFKKAYEKASDEIKNLDNRIGQILVEKTVLEKDVKIKPEIEKRIPEIEEEIGKINLTLAEKEKGKNSLLNEKEGLQKTLKSIEEMLATYQMLEREKERLDNEIKEFEKKIGGLKKEDIEARIGLLDQKLKTISTTLELLDKRNQIEARYKNLEEIVKTLESYRKPEELKQEEEVLRKKVDELANKIEDIKRNRMEIETKNSASKLYIKNLREETVCPLCKTELSEDRRIELITEIESEIKEYPNTVKNLDTSIEKLSREKFQLEQKLSEIIREYGRSYDAYKKIENLAKELPKEVVSDPKAGLKNLEIELGNISSQLTDNAAIIGLELKSLGVQRLIQVQNQLNKEKEELNKALSSYEKYEENISKLNVVEEQMAKLLPLEDEKNRLENKILQIDNLIKQVEKEINILYQNKGNKEKELEQLKVKLRELEDKEQQLKKKFEEEKELTKRKEILTIVKEQVFKDNAFPTVFLEEFVKHVQMNLSDFISRFKGGRYEIDISLTREGDVEVRARDRSKIDSTFRSIKDFSQGERTILGFAIRLATMKAISSYKGKSMPNILIVDEGFGPLDQENMKALIDGIKDLKNVFEQIFIITHIDQVKEEFEQRLIVEETPKGSIIKRI